MRHLVVALSLMLGTVNSAGAQVSIGIGLPSVQIGINVPVYPELVLVPGYPVYYDPRADSNYFFYDGVYWVFAGDSWYASSWYNGPWHLVGPERVPLYVLRVPVQYYRRPPPYFHAWRPEAPPRWGEHWGRGWERRRAGWDRWDQRRAPPPAPLPVYQRQYVGERYPREVERQHAIRAEQYQYRPRESQTREYYRPGPPGPRGEGPRMAPGPRGEGPRMAPGPRGEGPRMAPGPQPPPDQGRGHGREERRGHGDDDRGRDRR